MVLNIKNFKLAMANACIGMDELSIKSGVNITSIRRMINHQTNPRPKTIGRIAKALNVNVEYLVEVNSYE